MRKFHLLILLILWSFNTLFAQLTDDLFEQRSRLSKDYRGVVSKYQALELNTVKLSSLRQQSSSALQLQLPFEGRQLKLQLKKVKITADDFSVIEALPDGSRRTVNYSGGVFYQERLKASLLLLLLSVLLTARYTALLQTIKAILSLEPLKTMEEPPMNMFYTVNRICR
ncbi:MAG: hypothetical protein WDO16_01740 [Bacteroidota bacterium]